MSEKEIYLNTALKIANRIVNNAIWDNDKCTWKIYAPNMENPKERTGKWENANGNIYQGTAGIALFLAELYRITKEKKIADILIGAINNSLFESERLTLNSFGYHGGRVGIAYSTVLAGKYLEKEEYILKGLDVILPMLDKEFEDYGIDVIGGGGGAIQPLLKIYGITNNETVLNIALNLGESLIKKANLEPCGWSWGSGNSNYRNLCGYAHGASGIGHAFLELYNLTSSNYYLYAAEQAFIYERQFFDEEVNNWPDFRYSELSEYTHYNRINELKEALKKNKLIPYSIKYMSAWCHGAPGIGLSRLRAFELTHNELFKNESIQACENTMTSIGQIGNYSLCHGIFGNSETLLFGSDILSEKKYLDLVTEKAIEGIEKFEYKNLPWPCGTMNSISDPSLMVGESGIGYFFLRLYDNKTESVISIHSNKKECVILKDEKILRKQYLNSYFNETLKIVDTIEKREDSLLSQMEFSIGHYSDVKKAFELIRNYIYQTNGSYADKLNDLFILEKEKYLCTLQISDFSEEFLNKLTIGMNYKPDWKNNEFCLYKDCKLLVQKCNWSNYDSESLSLTDIKQDEQYFLLFVENNKIKVISINQLSYIILSSASTACSFENILKSVTDIFEIEPGQIGLLKQKIKEQLLNAYRSGFLKISILKNGAFV